MIFGYDSRKRYRLLDSWLQADTLNLEQRVNKRSQRASLRQDDDYAKQKQDDDDWRDPELLSNSKEFPEFF